MSQQLMMGYGEGRTAIHYTVNQDIGGAIPVWFGLGLINPKG